MNTTKAIAYSYPSSHNAEKLGFAKQGCWHLSVTYHAIEGSDQCNVFLPHDAEGFDTPDHPDLIAMFKETEGDICKHFLRFGNEKALKAIKK